MKRHGIITSKKREGDSGSMVSKEDELDRKLDFIVNRLFDILCHVDVHYEHELLGFMLGKAEMLGFNIQESQTWDYNESNYMFARNCKEYLEEYYPEKKRGDMYEERIDYLKNIIQNNLSPEFAEEVLEEMRKIK